MNITLPRAVIEQALEALENVQGLCTDANDGWVEAVTIWTPEAITALRTALEQPQPVQVSPLDFTYAVRGKEDAIGRPIFWAEWPNREKA